MLLLLFCALNITSAQYHTIRQWKDDLFAYLHENVRKLQHSV